MKPRGSVTKEEDPTPSHQHTSCRLSSHDQLGRLCVYGTHKRPLRAPTEENALVLTAVGIGGRNTEEQDQIRI